MACTSSSPLGRPVRTTRRVRGTSEATCRIASMQPPCNSAATSPSSGRSLRNIAMAVAASAPSPATASPPASSTRRRPARVGRSDSARATRGRGGAFMLLNAICALGLLRRGGGWRRVLARLPGGLGRRDQTLGYTEVSPVRVLIADDNRLMLEGFRRALEPVEDIEIVGATHGGSHVLALIERRRPEVVVIDLGMLTTDGDSCLDAIVAAYPEVKVAVLSSSASPAVIRSALSRGAHAFIAKAINPLDIPSVLRQTYEETVYHAFGVADAPEEDLRLAGLTEREITMLKALTRGLSNKAISQELWVTEQTVKFHLGNLYRKLGVQTRLPAASFAHQHGIAA